MHKNLDHYCKSKGEQMQVLKLIYSIREDHPSMGMRDLYFKILPESMGRDAFENFCKLNKLWSKKPKNYRRTTDSSGVIRFDNLLQTMTISSIDQAWQSDITYYEIDSTFYYITFIIDSYSRRIVGYNTSKRLNTEQTTLPALQMALKTRKGKSMEGLVFHSDGGGQYYSKAFLEVTSKQKMRNSMCEYAWENGKAERVNGTIKNNYLTYRKIESFEDLVREVDRSVLLYNSEKPHIALKRKSPMTYEKELLDLNQQTKPKMTESFDANIQIYGASSPLKSEQTKPQNQDVFYANILELSS